MAPAWRPAADRLVTSLRGIFRERLRSVVAYGSHVEGDGDSRLSCLAIVASITMADLEGCAQFVQDWRRDGVATPLLLPEDEFRESFDAFPLEYGEMMRAHETIFGADPFASAVIVSADLRRACETQIKSHLVHLREGFIEAGGVPRAIADLVTASAPAFGALLRNFARLDGSHERDRAAATRHGARLAQLPDAVVTDIVALERPSTMRTTDAARLYPEYLGAVEQLARFIDTWQS